MSKFIGKIKNYDLETWIKYWLYKRTGGTKYKFVLSDVKEGSNFHLENTIKRKFNIFEIFGKTTQNSTTGKNKFDIKKYLTDRNVSYTENSDGSLTFSVSQNLYSNPLVFAEENITVSLSGIIINETTNNARISLVKSNNVASGQIDSTTTSIEDKLACKLRFDWSSPGTVTMKNIQLETGSVATEYEPYTGRNSKS